MRKSWLGSGDHIKPEVDGRSVEGSGGSCAIVSGLCLLGAPLLGVFAGDWALGTGSNCSLPGGIIVGPGLKVSKGH